MMEKDIPKKDIRMVCYQNALEAFGKSGQINEKDWLNTKVDQSEKFSGNSILRGGQTPGLGTQSNIIT